MYRNLNDNENIKKKKKKEKKKKKQFGDLSYYEMNLSKEYLYWHSIVELANTSPGLPIMCGIIVIGVHAIVEAKRAASFLKKANTCS